MGGKVQGLWFCPDESRTGGLPWLLGADGIKMAGLLFTHTLETPISANIRSSVTRSRGYANLLFKDYRQRSRRSIAEGKLTGRLPDACLRILAQPCSPGTRSAI
jgi:hypothetical protein